MTTSITLTPEREAIVRRMWPDPSCAAEDVGRAVGKSANWARHAAQRLGLGRKAGGNERIGAAGRGKRKVRQDGACRLPNDYMPALADDVSALYAGRRYEDDPVAVREPRSFFKVPGTYSDSLMGCAAAMTEAA